MHHILISAKFDFFQIDYYMQNNILNNIISVSQLTNTISHLLDERIGYVRVQGEISNFKTHTSGHRYFTLKDDFSQISCTLWKTKYLNFQPADGMKVIVDGRVTIYPPRGQYQIECDKVQPVGKGELFLAYEALKEKLTSLGYFAQERKKKIPHLPLKVGIATSETGAAVRDMFSTISRRMPLMTIYFRPTIVQGDTASKDIAEAIKQLNQTDSEVIIIGRGGGSIEDLWAFNTEIVADAIINSKIPIISAVGHETDFTISDFCADMRASTPTAAAEIVTMETIDDLSEFLAQQKINMMKTINNRFNNIHEKINRLSSSYAFKRMKDRINILKQEVDDMEFQLNNTTNRQILSRKQKVNWLESRCLSLEPYSPLKKGFALLYDKVNLINNSQSLLEFETISILRQSEKVKVKIEGAIENEETNLQTRMSELL